MAILAKIAHFPPSERRGQEPPDTDRGISIATAPVSSGAESRKATLWVAFRVWRSEPYRFSSSSRFQLSRSPRVVVELDSWEHHSHRSAFERDRARDPKLLIAGYRTVRVTHRRLDREPDRLAAEIRQLLATPPPG